MKSVVSRIFEVRECGLQHAKHTDHLDALAEKKSKVSMWWFVCSLPSSVSSFDALEAPEGGGGQMTPLTPPEYLRTNTTNNYYEYCL